MKPNPQDTPLSREYRKWEKKGLKPWEVGDKVREKWPDVRTVPIYIYDRHARTAFTKFAKYLIAEGIAIDYDYQSKGEFQGDSAKGDIEVIGQSTPVPYEKLHEFNEEAGGPMGGAQWNFEVYDDEYRGEWDKDGNQIGRPKTNPGKLKAKLLR